MSAQAKSSQLVYKGHPIADRGEMLSLTDMWRASGADAQKTPAKWQDLPNSISFIEHVKLIVGKSDVLSASRGRNGATFAHWQIGMAYAQYLSPEFHMWCNQVVRNHMEGVHAAFVGANGQHELDLDPDDGLKAFRSEINRSGGLVTRGVDNAKMAILSYLSKHVLAGVGHLGDAIADLYRRTGKGMHTINNNVLKVHASIEELNSRFSPQNGDMAMVMSDWYGCGRIYRDLFGDQNIPRQGALSAAVSRSLDAYVLSRRLNHHVTIIDMTSKPSHIWHRDAVVPWFDQVGRRMIAAHISRYRRPQLTLVPKED